MIDVTVPISAGMATWPGDNPVVIQAVTRIAKGDTANISQYSLSSHTGTHVDPPLHFIPDGAPVDRVPLEVLVGPAVVVSVEEVAELISAADLAAADIPAGATRVLFKTRNSRLWDDPAAPFSHRYVSLAADGARWLLERGVRLVGIDYLSIEAFAAPSHPVHQALLSNGMVVVEGLDLRAAAPGEYQLVCLPLRVAGGDGGPARAVLLPIP